MPRWRFRGPISPPVIDGMKPFHEVASRPSVWRQPRGMDRAHRVRSLKGSEDGATEARPHTGRRSTPVTTVVIPTTAIIARRSGRRISQSLAISARPANLRRRPVPSLPAGGPSLSWGL